MDEGRIMLHHCTQAAGYSLELQSCMAASGPAMYVSAIMTHHLQMSCCMCRPNTLCHASMCHAEHIRGAVQMPWALLR